MTKKKKKYFPNKWKQYSEVPDEMFEPIEFDILMDWKIGGYEIPQSVTALIREKNLETGKVKEHIYINESDLYKKIIWAIQNYKSIRKTNLSAIASQFDWKATAPVYDKVMNSI